MLLQENPGRSKLGIIMKIFIKNAEQGRLQKKSLCLLSAEVFFDGNESTIQECIQYIMNALSEMLIHHCLRENQLFWNSPVRGIIKVVTLRDCFERGAYKNQVLKIYIPAGNFTNLYNCSQLSNFTLTSGMETLMTENIQK